MHFLTILVCSVLVIVRKNVTQHLQIAGGDVIVQLASSIVLRCGQVIQKTTFLVINGCSSLDSGSRYS